MNKAKINLCQPRSFGELFKVTIAFIKQNFKFLFKIIFIYVFSYLMIGCIAIHFIDGDSRNFHIVSGLVYGKFIMVLFYGIAIFLMSLISHTYVYYYVKSSFLMKEFSPKKILLGGFKYNFVGIFINSLLLAVSLVIIFSAFVRLCYFLIDVFDGLLYMPLLLLLIFSLIYCALPLIFTIPLKFEEPKLSFLNSSKKCYRVIKGNWLRSFAFLLIFYLLLYITSYLFFFISLFTDVLFTPFANNTIIILIEKMCISFFDGMTYFCLNIIFIAISILFYSLYENTTGNHLKEQIDSIGTGLNHDALEHL